MLGEFRGVKAEIISHTVWRLPANLLLLHLPQARNSLSARQGFRRVEAVCNCCYPELLWQLSPGKFRDWNSYFRQVLKVPLVELGLPVDRVAVLSTGVDMHHLACIEETYEELWVQAWVTAGVRTNALRIGLDRAGVIEKISGFEPVGTINIIVLTNVALTQAALAASFITITEAKTISLQDLDIRSSYNQDWQASGTGTDQVVVVSGREGRSTYVGGHSKLGEIMARAVSRATIKAIEKGKCR